MSRAPTSGARRMSVRIGTPRSSAGHHEHEVDGHDDEREGDAQGVVLDAPGLDLAQVAAGALDDVADAVDGAVDDGSIEPPQPVRDAPADDARRGRG